MLKFILYITKAAGVLINLVLVATCYKAKDILIGKYGNNCKKVSKSHMYDVFVTMVKFEIFAFMPLVNLFITYVCLSSYDELVAGIVDKFSMEIEARLAAETAENK